MSFQQVKDIAQEQGVSDLPLKVRYQFAKAVKAERDGDNTLAEAWLAKALDEVTQ